MTYIFDFLNYILSLESFVLIPIIMFILSLIIGLKKSDALKSSLTIGIGFIGISIIFSFFIDKLGPAIEDLILYLNLSKSALDVGWAPFALVTWGTDFASLNLIAILTLNIVLLLLKKTKTMNIDIFNFWHTMFVGTVVEYLTGSLLLSLLSTLIASYFMLKLADMVAPYFESFAGLNSVTSSTLSMIVYVPIGIIGGKILDHIPIIGSLNADAETIKKKFGIIGDPVIIGFLVGSMIGIGASYDIKSILELAMQFSAVIYILPKMTDILGESLKPISLAMQQYLEKKFPSLGKIYIGLDAAIILGEASVLVTGIILIPITLILALILPGITFIPLGDLSIMMLITASFVITNKGNVIRGIILGIPIIISHLYVASFMATTYTGLLNKYGMEFNGYTGNMTSFIDGGNLLRFFIIQSFNGSIPAIILVVILLFFVSYKKKSATTKF